MKEDIILIGGGGHCNSCIDVIELQDKFNICGIVDQKEKIGEKILDYEIIGSDDDLPELSKRYNNFLITVGQIKTPEVRNKLFNLLKSLKVNLPVIISPRAYVSKHSEIGEGTIIMHNAIINSNVQIGKNCIVNTKALIEHDSIIGSNCHISTSSIINGTCKIGDNCFVGSGSVISNNCEITNNVVLSLGTVVRKSIFDSGIYSNNLLKSSN